MSDLSTVPASLGMDIIRQLEAAENRGGSFDLQYGDRVIKDIPEWGVRYLYNQFNSIRSSRGHRASIQFLGNYTAIKDAIERQKLRAHRHQSWLDGRRARGIDESELSEMFAMANEDLTVIVENTEQAVKDPRVAAVLIRLFKTNNKLVYQYEPEQLMSAIEQAVAASGIADTTKLTDNDVTAMVQAVGQQLQQVTEAQQCPHCGDAMYPESMITEKKDACYYKVKSRYKVWPSAYASGALVQCRKKGAANWGSKSKNESLEETEQELLERKTQELEEDLRKWFKEKWVRFGPDGKIRGACARGDDSEGKPKCLPQKKAHALGKKGRASAASRKRRQDPDPERKGAAINVATKKNEDAAAIVSEKWSEKYKRSINCDNPRGFSQRAHCQGRKKNESVAEGDVIRHKFATRQAQRGRDQYRHQPDIEIPLYDRQRNRSVLPKYATGNEEEFARFEADHRPSGTSSLIIGITSDGRRVQVSSMVAAPETVEKFVDAMNRRGFSSVNIERVRMSDADIDESQDNDLDSPLPNLFDREYYIVYRRSGNVVQNTPGFNTREAAQKYLMTKMAANHHLFRVSHYNDIGFTESRSVLGRDQQLDEGGYIWTPSSNHALNNLANLLTDASLQARLVFAGLSFLVLSTAGETNEQIRRRFRKFVIRLKRYGLDADFSRYEREIKRRIHELSLNKQRYATNLFHKIAQGSSESLVSHIRNMTDHARRNAENLNITESLNESMYWMIYINDRPATKHQDREEANQYQQYLSDKYPSAKIELRYGDDQPSSVQLDRRS